MIETGKKNEKGLLVAVGLKSEPDEKLKEMMNELAFLTQTLSIDVLGEFTQKLEYPDPRTFVGKGKLEDIKAACRVDKIDVVVFDDDLSPSQLRNLERELKVKIYDRSLLILDIFLKRAKTAQAKTQVELARFRYLLPRLTRMWTHLERQKGGTATRGGAGEKEIETDRRIIRDQITLLRKKLEKIEKQSNTRRKSRKGIVRVALVGYTNAGKSTLMNLLGKDKVYAKDELFATVDSTVRKVVLNHLPFLLSDTVGFIRKLPHDLIESFKSTLAEIKEADILLHVIDASNPSHEDHIKIVDETLSEMGASDISTIRVFNKMDNVNESPVQNRNGLSTYISAKKGTGIEELRALLTKEVKKIHMKIYPHYIRPEVY
ncbi:MAG: GTPase HflX [Ekhidna sp.]|nr:GTPase HflX [Ekhidna sp.]MBC6424949.1 GTPase HflX [Ekhidna sp.]